MDLCRPIYHVEVNGYELPNEYTYQRLHIPHIHVMIHTHSQATIHNTNIYAVLLYYGSICCVICQKQEVAVTFCGFVEFQIITPHETLCSLFPHIYIHIHIRFSENCALRQCLRIQVYLCHMLCDSYILHNSDLFKLTKP